jgi:hypothetical protein
MSARAEKPLLSGVDGRPFDFGSGRSCREGLTGCSGSLADDPQKRASVGLSVGLCAEPRQIRRRYCCIIGVTGAGVAAGCVLM